MTQRDDHLQHTIDIITIRLEAAIAKLDFHRRSLSAGVDDLTAISSALQDARVALRDLRGEKGVARGTSGGS